MGEVISGPVYTDLSPKLHGYDFPTPAAGFDLANRAIAECFGMAMPPERYTRVEILKEINNFETSGWVINLTAPEGSFRVEMDADMETQKVFWMDDPPKPGHLRLVS